MAMHSDLQEPCKKVFQATAGTMRGSPTESEREQAWKALGGAGIREERHFLFVKDKLADIGEALRLAQSSSVMCALYPFLAPKLAPRRSWVLDRIGNRELKALPRKMRNLANYLEHVYAHWAFDPATDVSGVMRCAPQSTARVRLAPWEDFRSTPELLRWQANWLLDRLRKRANTRRTIGRGVTPEMVAAKLRVLELIEGVRRITGKFLFEPLACLLRERIGSLEPEPPPSFLDTNNLRVFYRQNRALVVNKPIPGLREAHAPSGRRYRAAQLGPRVSCQ